MAQDFSDPTSMGDDQLVSTIRREMTDIENTIKSSVDAAERQVSAAKRSVSAAEANAPKTDDMLSGCGGIGGCGCLIVLFCGLLNSCGLMAYSTYSSTANLFTVVCVIATAAVIFSLRKPAAEASKLRNTESILISKEKRLNEASQLRASVDDVCALMESTDPDDMLHDVYRSRLEGLLEDVRIMREQL